MTAVLDVGELVGERPRVVVVDEHEHTRPSSASTGRPHRRRLGTRADDLHGTRSFFDGVPWRWQGPLR